MEKGDLIVISGPSGVGKGTIIKELLQKRSDIGLSVSYTTRQIREGEENGKNYYYVSEQEFIDKIQNDDFIEWNHLFRYYYGTPLKETLKMIEDGKKVLFEIDVVGGLNIKKRFPDATLIFILPPTANALSERMDKRGSETEEQKRIRRSRAAEEYNMSLEYDYAIVNDDLMNAVNAVEEIIKNEENKQISEKAKISEFKKYIEELIIAELK